MKNFISRLTCSYTALEQKYRLRSLRGVFIFISLTLMIHYSFRYWTTVDYFPLSLIIHKTYAAMVDLVFNHSLWFIHYVLHYQPTVIDYTMYFEEVGYIAINDGCSGLKQFLQVTLLFLIYPGPWKHKLWYIPLGILLMHATNLFRIVGLTVVLHHWPEYWKFSHDYIFRPLFYVVIFTMWMVWEEKFARQGSVVEPANLEKDK